MGAIPNRTIWLDHLRAAITVLVVAHHASLAYTTFANFRPEAYILSTHPIVDSQRWIGLDIFENFNDVFFMSLMFFISGVFVLPALQKKGVALFLRDRFYRLFLPFLVAVSLLMLLAYYPAYLVAHQEHNLKDYILDFFTTEQWPVGPPWFIWVLFAFNLIVALLYPLLKKQLVQTGQSLATLKNKPGRLFVLLLLLTALLYIPMAIWVGPGAWTGFYPFDFQLSRVFLYFGYFVLGMLAGAVVPSAGILSATTPANRLWPLWAVLCIAAYAALTLMPPVLIQWVKTKQLAEPLAWAIYFTLYVSSCTLSCLAFLFTFKARVHNSPPFMQSLTANAYGIYLVHYIFIVWCQYLLMPWPFHAAIKFAITFILALSLSWALTVLLRRNRTIRKYL
jgi:hypothetical protein